MITGIANGSIQGWTAYKSPKRYKKYGSQKGWERVNQPPSGQGWFSGDYGGRSPADGASILKKHPVDSLVDVSVDSRLTEKILIFQALFPFVNHVNQEIKEKVIIERLRIVFKVFCAG